MDVSGVKVIIEKLKLTLFYKPFSRENSRVDKRHYTSKTNIKELNLNVINVGDQEKGQQLLEAIKKGELPEKIKMSLPSSFVISNEVEDREKKLDKIGKRIDEAVALIKLEKLLEARTILLEVLGEIKSDSKLKDKLPRVYNNIGVTYNTPTPEGNYDKAIEYFEKALEIDSNFTKSKVNLAAACLNRGKEEDIQNAYTKANVLWAMGEKTSDTLQVLLWTTYKNEGIEGVSKLLNGSDKENIDKLIEANSTLADMLSAIYMENRMFDLALSHIEKAIILSPDQPEPLGIKAKILLAKTQENEIPSEFDVIPKFQDYQAIEEALRLFEDAKKIAEKQGKKHLFLEIEYGIATSQIWLGKYDEAKSHLKVLQKEEVVDEKFKHSINVLEFAGNINSREFESALRTLREGEHYKDLPYAEMRRLARIFLYQGAPEQAKNLLDEIETKAEIHKDFYYWLDLSVVCIFLGRKDEAITAVTKAKKICAENEKATQDEKKIIFSHFAAVMARYSKKAGVDTQDSEVERLLPAMMEYHKQFPEDKAVFSLKAIDEETGEISEEMKKTILSHKESYENLKNIFKSQPIPTYLMEKRLGRAYAEIIVERGDPDFTIEFTNPTREFNEELDDNFKKANGLVFDYISLIDLSKMNFLGFLEKLEEPVYVHEKLFNKIQEELVKVELTELRRLWDFLRKSKNVVFIREKINISLSEANQKISDYFEEWIVETIKFAKLKELPIVTDDLRFLRFVKSENINAINISPILRHWKAEKNIDEKMYSRAIGDLAERFYIFLSYNSQDLLEIVSEDNMKLTLRSYHLIREIFLPGANLDSFTKVFAGFIDLLWKTGSLPEDKVFWLKHLSGIILEIFDNSNLLEDLERLQQQRTDFGLMWGVAIRNASKSDLLELRKIVSEVLNRPYLEITKNGLQILIDEKIEKS